MPHIEELHPGAVCRGTVTAMSNTTLFVDLHDAPAVVTAPNLSWKKFTHPSQISQVGDEVVGIILNVDTEHNQVSLSLKELERDPLLDFAQTQIGAVLTGRADKATPIGVFFEVEENISGLLPVAELPNGVGSVKIGEEYSVLVSSINVNERKITLTWPE